MRLLAAFTFIVTMFPFYTVANVDNNHRLAEELISIQEEFLSAISPRPTGEDLQNSPLYAELVRRISLTNENWIHQERGRIDAAESKGTVILLSKLSDIEKAYLKLLQSELGMETRPIPANLNGNAARFYTYGFNTVQLDALKEEVGGAKLRALIHRASAQLGYKSTSTSSLLFVPWRFSDGSKPAIEGLHKVPKIR